MDLILLLEDINKADQQLHQRAYMNQ